MPTPPIRLDWSELQTRLRAVARDNGSPTDWPTEAFELFAEAEVFRWTVPEEYGGVAVSQADLVEGYIRLSEADLVSTFVLTQHNAAIARIVRSENEAVRSRWLPPLASGEQIGTVGISHLTTSRQHVGRPVVRANPIGAGFVFEGTIPWATGATRADVLLVGAVLDDGQQMLATVSTDQPTIVPQTPGTLLALSASQTGAVELNGVTIDPENVVDGPVDNVMTHRGSGSGAGSVTTSALAIGVARAALVGLETEAERRPDLREVAAPMRAEWDQLHADLQLAVAPPEADTSANRPVPNAAAIRQRANSLCLRSTQAYLAACKGAGFVHGHLAERLVRQAMFFLVWSCPQPVLAANLREFACVTESF